MADLISKNALVTKLSQGYWNRELQQAKNDPCVIDAMIDLAIRIVKEMPLESPWQTGTPTENGYYFCKVFYDKYTPNDMRILEWVSSLNCFCIPYSEIRAYHYYVGENNGEDAEVVYEWQKLDMRFRMETKWIEPYKEKEE